LVIYTCAEYHTDHLAGVKVLHGLDKVAEGGTVVLTIRDQPILADGDINEGTIAWWFSYVIPIWIMWVVVYHCKIIYFSHMPDVDMLENVEIGEQKRRDDAYKAAKKKTGIYDDK